MATNLELVSDALREINVIAEVQTASAEQGVYCLRKLNEMMEAWTEDGIEVGWFEQSSTTDTAPLPPWVLKTVKAALAVEVAPQYGASVSPELAKKFEDGYGMLIRKSIVEALKPASMSHMPQGEGKTGGDFDITAGWPS